MRRDPLAVWSWRSAKSGKTNFGDELGPVVLERLGYSTRRVALADAEILTAGSVLQTALRDGRDGLIVWGTGLIKEQETIPQRDFHICAVRGRRTAMAMGVDVPLGDPGILASMLWERPKVRYRVGVVPHYVDRRGFSWADKVIDVSRPVDEVIEDIASCACIATSSLHGMIIAQSYGIPAVRLPHEAVQGGDFKWTDHITSLDRPIEQVQTELVEALRKEID